LAFLEEVHVLALEVAVEGAADVVAHVLGQAVQEEVAGGLAQGQADEGPQHQRAVEEQPVVDALERAAREPGRDGVHGLAHQDHGGQVEGAGQGVGGQAQEELAAVGGQKRQEPGQGPA